MTPIIAVAPACAATTTTTNQTNFFQGLVNFIAQKFGLDKTQVQTAVSDYANQRKIAMQENRQNREKTHLDSLVTKGTITSEQEQQILNEQAKLHSEYTPASFKNLNAAQRQAQMQKEQAEIQAWSTSTGISATYLRWGSGFGMGRGMRHFGWGNSTPTPTPTPSS